MILAVDVGGTKTNFALYQAEGKRLILGAFKSAASPDFPSLQAALASFLLSPRPPIEAAGIGVAGPVVGGAARTTNLSWKIERSELQGFLGITAVIILNDLVAMAQGIEMLGAEDLLTIQEGEPDPDGNAALIASGTGLGEAILVRHEGRLIPSASEGGHSDFAPIDGETNALLGWLRGQVGHVSVERVVSGIGLEGIYRFFHDPDHGGSPPHVPKDADVPRVVAEAARSGACPGCGRAFGLFLRCFGAEAGNLALKAAATNGLYVGGGIAYRNAEAIRDGRFLCAFHDKGRFAGYMERVPLHVIMNPTAPLLGAALAAGRASGILP